METPNATPKTLEELLDDLEFRQCRWDNYPSEESKEDLLDARQAIINYMGKLEKDVQSLAAAIDKHTYTDNLICVYCKRDFYRGHFPLCPAALAKKILGNG